MSLAVSVPPSIEVDAGIAHALGAELGLQVGHRRVADGDDDALVDGRLDEVVEGGAAGMAHDLDAGRLGGDRLLELVDHGLRRPGRELLLEVDAEGRGRLRGAGLAGERGAVAGVAAHLHVHGEAFADQSRPKRCRPPASSRDGGARQAVILVMVMFVFSLCLFTAPRAVLARPAGCHSAERMRPNPCDERMPREEGAAPLRLVDIEVEDDRDQEDRGRGRC